MKEEIDSSCAERWLDPDTFVYKKKIYRITLDFKIVEVKDEEEEKNGH